MVSLSQLSLIIYVTCRRDVLLTCLRRCFEVEIGASLVIVDIVSALHR